MVDEVPLKDITGDAITVAVTGVNSDLQIFDYFQL
jgi:hypothetical protein